MRIPSAIIKYNGGALALLCSKCRVIIKTGATFTEDEKKYARGELKHLEPLICTSCKTKNHTNESENL